VTIDRTAWTPPSPDEFRFVAPVETPFVVPGSRGELPHLTKPLGTYFVTFRLRDALVPMGERAHSYGPPATPGEVALRSEPPLRRGSCTLARADVASLVERALLHFDRDRYLLHSWCILPNHAHVVVSPAERFTLPGILHSWKSFTATRINRMVGRSGALWERESFDHLVRSEEDLNRFVEYVEENPVAADLVDAAEEWQWSSARFRRRAGDRVD